METIKELKKVYFESLRHNYEFRNFEEELSLLEEVSTGYDDDCDLYDAICEQCEEQFIYYADAFDYIKDSWITDFEDAINECGAKDICSIATYYFEQNVFECLGMIGKEEESE